jgi:tetratricopeptide (TPR) repeat protein
VRENRPCHSILAVPLLACLLLIVRPLGIAQTATHTPTAATKGAAQAPAAQAQRVYFQTEAAFILSHDGAKARLGFLRVVQIDPRNAPAWFNLGVLAESDKDWLKAESDIRRYLVLAPEGPDVARATEQLALLPQYASGKMTPEAAKSADYDTAIQRARVFMAAGRFRESIAEAGHAESLDPSRWAAYAVVSLCMARQNKTQEATKFEALAVTHAPASKRDQVRAALSPTHAR